MFDFLLRLAAQPGDFTAPVVVICFTICFTVLAIVCFRGTKPEERPAILRVLADLFRPGK